MKIYLDMCDVAVLDDISIDVTFDCIDWYNQDEIEMEMDRTVDNMEFISYFIQKVWCAIIIHHTEDPDLSFTIDVDKLDIRITEWTIFIYIKK